MGCRGRIAAIVATCVDARPVLAIVAGSLYVVAVVATVLGRAEAEGADATWEWETRHVFKVIPQNLFFARQEPAEPTRRST